MPATFTHNPAKEQRKEPGHGGQPPPVRRPTGGGGNGDDNWGNRHSGPRDLLLRIRFFVFSALAADMLFFAVMVMLFFARQAGTHMDPRSHEQIGDWHPVALPPILFLNTAALLVSCLTMELGAAQYLPRNRRAGGVAWTGPPGAQARPSLARGHAHARLSVSHRSMDGLEAVSGAGLCLRPVFHPGQLLLLSHHRPPRCSFAHRSRCADPVPEYLGLAQACRVPADRRGRNSMVLARHELRVGASAGRAHAGAIKPETHE